MRSIWCLLIVSLSATTALAQFSRENAAGLLNQPKATDATTKKTANERAHGSKAAAAAIDADLVDSLLLAMDTDHDGVVTKSEMTKAMAALRKVPRDKQGNMTVPEKAPADPNAAPDAGPDAGLGQGPGGIGAPATADGRVHNEAMGRFMQMDANHDGVLSPNEVPAQSRNMLRSADMDNNGVIDARELQMFSHRMGERMKAFNAGANPRNPGATPGDNSKP